VFEEFPSIRLPARIFKPLELSSYDVLFKDIMWVGVYHGQIKAEEVALILNAGLVHFPHLTGYICKSSWKILPCIRDLQVETEICDQEFHLSKIEDSPYGELREKFIPNEEQWIENKFLFGSRVVQFSNASVIGIRVSHCAVDGTGFGLFLRASIQSLMHQDVSPVLHERMVLSSVHSPQTFQIPQGYECEKDGLLPKERDQSKLKRCEDTLFISLSIAELSKKWDTKSHLATRLKLAAWLSAECKKADPELREMAVWCDVRGLGDFPQNFTGNCGCFLHFPLSESMQEMEACWKKLISRVGFRSINEVFRQLQEAERREQALQWKNDPSYLQINIIPNSISNLDFGYGKALFGTLLTRNSSGIRISVTPDEQFFSIEAEVSKKIHEHLIQAMHFEKWKVKLWEMNHS
jgi:hypothetical protein